MCDTALKIIIIILNRFFQRRDSSVFFSFFFLLIKGIHISVLKSDNVFWKGELPTLGYVLYKIPTKISKR